MKEMKEKFLCTQCGISFQSRYSMQCHFKREHEKSLEFSCETCSKKYPHINRLKTHIWQSHTPVKCEICQKTVATSRELRKHKFFVHNNTEGAWQCQECPKKVFFLKTNFEKHVNEKH